MTDTVTKYTPEYIAARKKYLLRAATERQRLERLKGHTFTRRTYRRARAKALTRVWAAYDTYLLANSRDAWLDVRIARWEAEQIVARGRREKGLWRA